MAQDWDTFKALNRVLCSPHHSPGSIAKACQDVQTCIANNRDNLRGFFQQCFPDLLKRTFGYDDFEASWLNMVTKPGRDADAKALKALLSPNGPLFQAMESADKDKRIQFSFPPERLPAHTQELLKSPSGRKTLDRWPQYSGRIIDKASKPCVHLNVYEYFIFWNAFYVLRGGRASDSARGVDTFAQRGYMSGIKRMGTMGLPGLGPSTVGVRLPEHPYYEVLRLYLSAFLPQPGAASQEVPANPPSAGSVGYALGAYPPAPGLSSSLFSSSQYLTDLSKGDILLNVLIEFWLTDNAEPVPADLPTPELAVGSRTQSPGAPPAVAPPSAPLRTVSYQPPSEELVEGLICLFRHLDVIQDRGRSSQPAQTGAQWVPPVQVVTQTPPQGRLAVPLSTSILSGPSAAPPFQLLSRKLYRFLRRTLSLWPSSSSMPLTPIITLWLTHIAPWEPISRGGTVSPSSQSPLQGGGPYGGGLERASSLAQRLHLTRTESNAGHRGVAPTSAHSQAWRPHVLSLLPLYSLLLPHFLELCFLRLSYKAELSLKDMLMLLRPLAACPDLVAELRSVEDALNRYLRSVPRRAEGEYADILAWLADQAQDWEQAALAGIPTTPPLQADATYRMFSTADNDPAYLARAIIDASRRLQGVPADLVDAVEAAARAVLPIDQLPSTFMEPAPPALDETTLYPKKGRWQEVQRYHGNWLHRPIASYEVGCLVRPLVRVSELLNSSLGLDKPWKGQEEEPPENIIQEVIGYARRKRWVVDLRFLAEKATLAWLIVLIFMVRWFWGFGGTTPPAGLPDVVPSESTTSDILESAAPGLTPDL